MADEQSARDQEIDQLRRSLALARFWLDRFADPHSFVWRTAGRSPHEFARTALQDVDEGIPSADPGHLVSSEGRFPVGTGRMEQLTADRAGFVEFHQVLARQALEIGEVRAARAALHVLRPSDFGPMSEMAGSLLAVIRDGRSSDEQVADAAHRLTRLAPAPADTAD